MDSIRRDLRLALRSLRRSPWFLLVTALTLSLGIGATTAIFSVVNAVLLQPLPYPGSERIVQLFQVDKDGARMSVSLPNFQDWNARTRSFEAMAAVLGASTQTINGLAEPVRARVTRVTGSFFTVLGMQPELGRSFNRDELQPGAAPTVVVSDAFWREHLGGTSAALGKTVRLGEMLATVIGVMPPALNYPAGAELWIPIEIEVGQSSRTSHGWRVLGRLRPGVTLEQAHRELSAVSRQMKVEYGDGTWMSDGDLTPLREQIVGKVRPTLLVLMGASLFLLLIACGNVVNLVVARMTLRHTEIGVRLALGASRLRLAQQLVLEAGVLSAIGGLGGVALAAVGLRVLLAMQTGGLPRVEEIYMSPTVVVFAIGLSLATTVALGLLAAWQGTRAEIRDTLSAAPRTLAGSGSGAGVRRALVLVQMALTVVLLVGSGLLIRSLIGLLSLDPGYRTQHTLVLTAELPYESGEQGQRRRVAFYDDLMSRLRALPGVTAVGGVTGFPLVGGGSDGEFLILSRSDEAVDWPMWDKLSKDPSRSGYANFLVVDGDYFRAMGIPVVRGRVFGTGDTPDAPHAAVISESLARATWPGENPIGKIIEYGNMDGDIRPFTVVGVVGDVRDRNLAVAPTPTFYAYLPQRPRAARSLHVAIQTAGDPAPLATAAQSIVRRMRPDLSPVTRTIETVVSTSVADRRFALLLIGVFGGAALLLATLGVYSLISYLVAQRRQEIGVRIALGAQRGDVQRLVLRQATVLAAVGIAIGAAAALLLARLLRGLVYGVSTTDPITFASVVALLLVVAAAASWLPARRAAAVDPVEALRT